MSYFKIFPNISYPYNAEGERKIAKNILKRFSFKDYIKSNADLFVRYQMKDGESYQSLAKKLYGSPDLHWILYLMNDIQDPYTDIPKNSQELQSYIKQKYTGYVIFLDLNSFGGDFSVGEAVTCPNGYSATVTEWDGNMRKLVVDSESGTPEGIITGSASLSTGTVKRRIRHDLAVHHFEDLYGNKISALPNPLIQNDASPLDAYLDQSQQVDTKIVTNIEYEESMNDEKKKIKILRVEYRDQILADAERVFK